MIKAINKFVDKILTALHLIKFREQILYLAVGGMTTAVDWVVFTIFALFVPSVGGEFIKKISPNILAYFVAWFAAVIFAYFASRIFVFKQTDEKVVTQFAKFFGSRALTLVFSIVGDILLCGEYAIWKINNPWIAKLIISVVVIIVNYITSKLLVFTKKKTASTETPGENVSDENGGNSEDAKETPDSDFPSDDEEIPERSENKPTEDKND